MTPEDAALAEYTAMRAEILQINNQIVTVFSGTLALDVSILGWLFSKDEPSNFYALPTVGVFFTVLGSTVLANRHRLAHRLGMFQKHFIEAKLPGIRWASVYFRYRDRIRQTDTVSTLGERLTESGFLLGVGVLNLLILIFFGIRPYWTTRVAIVDWPQLFNLGVAVLLLFAGWLVRARLLDYRELDGTMKKISEEDGIARPAQADVPSTTIPGVTAAPQ